MKSKWCEGLFFLAASAWAACAAEVSFGPAPQGETIENLRFNGQPVTSAADARFTIGAHVRNVNVKGQD